MASRTLFLLALLCVLPSLGCGDDETPSEPGSAIAEMRSAEGDRLPEVTDAASAQELLEQIQDAIDSRMAEVQEARANVSEARGYVDDAQVELEAAEKRQVEAESALEEVRRRLAQAEALVEKSTIPDPLLFRAVQRQLLEASALDGVAIGADVSKGTVTLRGEVPDEATREAAAQIAAAVPGVLTVNNEIELAD